MTPISIFIEMQRKEIDIGEESTVIYIENFLSDDETVDLFEELKEKVPWTHGIYNMFGKKVKTPRLLFAMKDKNADITGSYKVTDSIEWTKKMEKIKKKIEKITKRDITYAQLNYYRDGNDYIGFHTDSEVQKGDIIASISLGAKRKFVFMKIDDKKNKITMELESGSLLIMDENAAKYKWKHSLIKMKDVGERINITFRPR
jgi:alkylated DNA repair dioxygenase AlkB